MRLDLSPRHLLTAYANGIFPMADNQGAIHWFSPDPRAILELDSVRISRSLRSVIRGGRFRATLNQAFSDVIAGCADRPDGTWISRRIREAYQRLHELGFAHSVETWFQGRLAGGLYGVALGGAFFGESMFHRETNASKVALVQLVQHLRERGFRLLDTQFQTPHLRSLGAIEIPRSEYEHRLDQAIRLDCSFHETSQAEPSRPRSRS
jgi:leucyl/phenylalanyl-tRNA--protein transferase